MEERLRKQLLEDNEKLEARLAKIEARVEELETRWERDAAKQMESLSKKSEDFSSSLERLQQEQDNERKARLKREASLVEQVENHAKDFEARWDAERKFRMDRMSKLELAITEQEATREEEQVNFQRRIDNELEALKAELVEEVHERKSQDDEIVSALNRYTEQLQYSLSILSSD